MSIPPSNSSSKDDVQFFRHLALSPSPQARIIPIDRDVVPTLIIEITTARGGMDDGHTAGVLADGPQKQCINASGVGR